MWYFDSRSSEGRCEVCVGAKLEKQFAPDGQAVLSQRAMLSGRVGSAAGDLELSLQFVFLCVQCIPLPVSVAFMARSPTAAADVQLCGSLSSEVATRETCILWSVIASRQQAP